MNFHRHHRNQGARLNHTARSAKSPTAKTGLFAPLRAALLRAQGSSAVSLRLLAFVALALAALLAFTAAASASATTPNFCPPGSAAGHCDDPASVAVDQSTGTVYIVDVNNNRIDEFDSSGSFIRAFGLGVANGADELQVCTTLCIAGHGGFRPTSLAVDPSSHDLYVSESAPNFRVQKFDPEGHFLLMFGQGVNHTAVAESRPEAEQNLCPAPGHPGDLCGEGSQGTGPGQLGHSEYFPLALDSSGDLWLGDVNRLERFSEAGAFLSEVKLPGAGVIQSLALDSSGDFYVHSFNENPETFNPEPVPGVQRFDPSGTLLETLDASGHPNALALAPATDNLFVSDQENQNVSGTATLLEFDPSGAQIEAFGSGEVIGGPKGNALAFGDTAQRLYVASNAAEINSAAQAFTLPEPGPLPISGTTLAKEIEKTSATLCAEVNPEGASTTVHFQYITAADFKADGESFGTGTVETAESASLGSDFQPHEHCQQASPLLPATAYRFRVVATNTNAGSGGVNGETAEFTTLPPAAIDSTGVAEVTADSATLLAEINPLGDPTSYRFEYLTEAAFLANGESFSGPEPATQVPFPDAAIGAGTTDVAVSQHLQGLQGATVYRYRVVVLNAVSEANGGPFAGPTLAFTTQGAAASGLPDHRAWEQVSPPDKHGASLAGINTGVIQTSASGEAITYLASAPTEAAPQGNSGATQVLSTRGGAGWSSLDLNPPHEAPTGATAPAEYRFFSADLSLGLLRPGGSVPLLSPAASEQTPYLRTNFPSGAPTQFCGSSCYRPLVTGCLEVEPCSPTIEDSANVPPGTEFATPTFLGANPDLSHVVLGSAVALTSTPLPTNAKGLYMWSAAQPPSEQLRLLSLLPGGEPTSGEPAFGFEENKVSRNAISTDGSRVVFAQPGGHLYLRLNATEPQSQVAGTQVDGSQCTEPDLACTIQLDALQGGPGATQPPAPHFQTASADGSRVFFTDRQQLTPDSGTSSAGGDLYEYDLARPLGQRISDLTPEDSGEPAAVQGILPGASEDGSYVYFVANGALTADAVPGDCRSEGEGATGSCNLYLRHAGRSTLIALLSGDDVPDWGGRGSLRFLTARISPDGRWLAFMSDRPLTGYDNRDAVSGQRDEEVFLYHAAADGGEGKLICASCNPTGARPHGVEYTNGGQPGSQASLPLAGGDRVWPRTTWLAANIPGWTQYALNEALYQSRYLSNSGRLFFNSSDALVPADTNGAEDVYQYEPPQGGENAVASNTCTTSAPTYSPISAGCVDLISSGTSAKESAFLDASETGDDVFFLTSAQLAKTDTDTSLDVYDVRVDGGFPEAVKPVECSGDACQPPAVPPNDVTPGSLTFSGAGNVVECPKGKVKRHGRCVKKHKHRKHHKKHHKPKAHKRPSPNRRGQK
jgi:hypothetical protein